MSQPSQRSEHIKQAIIESLDLLSQNRQDRLLLEICAMVKAQREEHASRPEMSEATAISTCAVSDEALEAQEKVLDEVINRFEIEKVLHSNLAHPHSGSGDVTS